MRATEPAVRADAALRDGGGIVTRGLRQELFVRRSCVPLDVIDFESLSPDTLDTMTTGECHGMCRN